MGKKKVEKVVNVPDGQGVIVSDETVKLKAGLSALSLANKLTNIRIDRLVDAIDKSKKVKGI